MTTKTIEERIAEVEDYLNNLAEKQAIGKDLAEAYDREYQRNLKDEERGKRLDALNQLDAKNNPISKAETTTTKDESNCSLGGKSEIRKPNTHQFKGEYTPVPNESEISDVEKAKKVLQDELKFWKSVFLVTDRRPNLPDCLYIVDKAEALLDALDAEKKDGSLGYGEPGTDNVGVKTEQVNDIDVTQLKLEQQKVFGSA